MENEMKKVKWSSGEPSCEWDYPVSEDHTSTSAMAILDESGEVVAFAVTAFAGFRDAKKEKELDANARLISAAPDLLEALQLMLEHAKRERWAGEFIGKAIHAIDKATGVKR